jgi:predicted dehydrogenase
MGVHVDTAGASTSRLGVRRDRATRARATVQSSPVAVGAASIEWLHPVVRVGVVGYGYWGPNLVRNFAEVAGAEVVAVSDVNADRLALAQARHPSVSVTTDCQDLFDDPDIDAIVVATPVATHFRLGMEALQAGKHVLMSKPLVDSSHDALLLIKEAEERQRVLMVDHTFIYTGAVRKIKELVDAGSVGPLHYYDSVRINLGLFQPDVNVLWDLAVHDLAIMDYILNDMPYAVAATGASHIPGHPTNTAYLTCFFPGNLLAHHHVSWLAPVKVRRTLIGGSRQMVVYDDLEPSEKVKVYDKGVIIKDAPERLYESLVGYRTGDMWAPHVPLTEALRVEARHFVECVRTGVRPLTDGAAGLRVACILEAAEESLRYSGKPIDVPAVVEQVANA